MEGASIYKNMILSKPSGVLAINPNFFCVTFLKHVSTSPALGQRSSHIPRKIQF